MLGGHLPGHSPRPHQLPQRLQAADAFARQAAAGVGLATVQVRQLDRLLSHGRFTRGQAAGKFVRRLLRSPLVPVLVPQASRA